jgi:hypothetical protein
MIIEKASINLLMSYVFAFKEGRWRDVSKFGKICIELERRAGHCLIVVKEKRIW